MYLLSGRLNLKKTGLIFFFVGFLATTPFAVAELAINAQTGHYYSKGAHKNVDQDEYHFLCMDAFNRWALLSAQGNSDEIALSTIFFSLRTWGTPAALRVMHDFEIILKTFKEDARRINRL